jgi:undecaprenyl-diphosphatase
MNPLVITAILLGIVEGVTEFLPVSSTGHLILASELLGYDAETWKVFNVVIQLGAIMAIVVLYWGTFMRVLKGLLARDSGAIHFVRNILIAFLPAAVIGLAIHKKIEAMLGHAQLVAWALIIGGIAIIVIERMTKRVSVTSVESMPLKSAVGIGFIQCLAMIPGVSRSGATIMGALSLGVDRKTAAEFSFFLAIPTMLGATVLELFKNRDVLGNASYNLMGIGFVVSFLVAIVVVKAFVAVISKIGFTPFAVYRIIAGIVALIWLNQNHIA